MSTVTSTGLQMHALLTRLFPLCRSITGNGVRETFRILQEYIPLKIMEVPSGTRVFDWTIPDEWNISDAYIMDSSGHRVVDFRNSNLHVIGYSVPIEGKMTLRELKPHLHSLPDQPDLIPYVTSYYQRTWGFCLPHSQLQALKDDIYEVKIISSLEPGHLTLGEFVLPGQTRREILFSTYICHPSLANNELSGPVLTVFLANHFLNKETPYYTYRFVFVPETIGAITYLSLNKDALQKNVVAGYVVTCVGDPGPFSYLKSRHEETLTDRITMHVLQQSGLPFKIYDFLSRESDERQYCAPGIDLPIGSLMRSKYHEYPEYHTSADDLTFVTPEGLADSLKMYMCCIAAIEQNHRYRAKILCEPQLGRRGLYPNLSKKNSTLYVKHMMDLLAYCDGQKDLLWIAEKLKVSFETLVPLVRTLIEHDVIERVVD